MSDQSRRTASRVRLRLATPADRPMLERWDQDPVLIEAAGSDGDWNWEVELPRIVPWREFLIAELDDRAFGFLQIIDAAEEETHYWGEIGTGIRAIDIWIGEPDKRGRGLGTEMMRQAIAHCFADNGCRAILIDPLASNVRAHKFYEQFGFRAVDRRMFGDDDCIVYRLDR